MNHFQEILEVSHGNRVDADGCMMKGISRKADGLLI